MEREREREATCTPKVTKMQHKRRIELTLR